MSSLDEYRSRFLVFKETFEGRTASSILWFDRNLSLYFRQQQIVDVSEITQESVQNWIQIGKTRSSWSPKTIRNRLQAVSSFCDWLIREGEMAVNPVCKIPRPTVPKRIPRSLSLNKAVELLEWTNHYPYRYAYERPRGMAILAIFLYAGLRREEVRNLKFKHVDLERGTLFVDTGKCSKDRIVPIHDKLRQYLKNYLVARQNANKTCPHFFTCVHKNEQMGYEVIPKLCNRIRKASGIDFYPHLLRHTFATLMLEGGCDVYTLSRFMGHSDIRTTTLYLSASDGHMRKLIQCHPI